VFWWVVEQRAYPTLRVVTVPKRGVMETIAPEHVFGTVRRLLRGFLAMIWFPFGFWNACGQGSPS